MNTEKEFPIIIRHKIPYLSEMLFWGIGISFLVFLLFYAAMSPTKYSSDEITVAYYILVIPDWLKNISAIALGSFIILVPVYYRARFRKSALLTIQGDKICIIDKQGNETIAGNDISRVYFNDQTDLFRQPKYKIQIAIKSKYGKPVAFQLRNYDDTDAVLTTLSSITNAEFTFLETSFITILDD